MQYKTKDEYVDAIQLKAPMSIRRASNQNDDFGEIGDWLVIANGESKFMSNDEFQSKYQIYNLSSTQIDWSKQIQQWPIHTGLYPFPNIGTSVDITCSGFNSINGV